MNNYEWLVDRLDAFIRKYYANKVIRGSLVFLSCLLLFVLTASVGEYFLYMPVWLRLTIMSLFVVLGLSSLIVWVAIPLARMARLGAVISHEQAANIIGTHFPEVSDRLLNILQLKKQGDSTASVELAEASINQKIKQISVVPIGAAIDLSRNRRYLRYLLPLLLIGVFILVAAPNVFREGSSRLLSPTRAFEKPAPFRFIIRNTSMKAVRNQDFVLEMETQGNALPAEAYVEINGEQAPMQPAENRTFRYTFHNVTNEIKFRFYAAGFYSSVNAITVVQRPVLKSFRVEVDYPAYTGRKNETRNSLGDMTVPAGTTVRWALETDHTDNASIRFGYGAATPLHSGSGGYNYNWRFLNDTSYVITLTNKAAAISDSYRYTVQVIPDQYPVIQIQQFKDTVTGKQVLITGSAGDDYGITHVALVYDVSDKNRTVQHKSIPVKSTQGLLTTFQQYLDIQSINLQSGQKLSYYIEAWDNDGVHGSKSSRSEVMTYFMYNDKQMDSAINANSKQISSGISNSAQQTKELQTDYHDMQSKMLQSQQMDWQQQQSLQDMLKKQMELKNNLENIKQRFEEQMQQSEQKKYSEELKDKQKELDKQLDNLLNQDLKDQLKKLQELMQKLNKDQALDAMKQMEQDNKLFKMDMERMDALMKQMEQQMRMEDMANKMDDLANKERALQKKTEEAEKNNKDIAQGNKKEDASKDKVTDKDKAKAGKDANGKDQKGDKDQKDSKDQKDAAAEQKKEGAKDDKALAKEQEALKKELQKAMADDMKDIKKLAKETKQPDNMQKEEDMGKEAEKDMEESEKDLDQKEKDKAGKKQDQAASNLENMAKSLRQKSGGMGAEQIEIDIKATRQILTNLIRLSFDQEDLMADVAHTSPASQKYVTNQEEQNRLYGNSRMIKDSLFSLSKRIVKLSPSINKETTELEQHMKKAVDGLENRNVNAARTDEQYVMTNTNNLALMLNELLANLMQQQAEGKKSPGEGGTCSKPGQGKPGKGKPSSNPGQQLSDIITKQQQLGNAMQQMKGGEKPGDKSGDKSGNKPGDKDGNKPGQGKKPGQQGSQGGNGGNSDGNNSEYGDAEQLARMAEQQAQIRRQIQELTSLLNSKGLSGARELREIADKMDKNETDLVNRKTAGELQQRQRDIQTRLLEAEKSLREQQQDDKRSSQSAKDISRPVPPALQKYITDQQQLLELYKTVPPQLKPYYRDMVESYFHLIKS